MYFTLLIFIIFRGKPYTSFLFITILYDEKEKNYNIHKKNRKTNINRDLYVCDSVFFLKIERLVAFEGTLGYQQSLLQNIVFVFKKQS